MSPFRWPWSKDDERIEPANTMPDYGPDDEVEVCPSGGEHDIVEVRASTSREVLSRYCRKCREDL